jgi:NAD(P)-dependent dehydrogenase (short-subunit alcohol dehydrogenase family)
MGALDGRVAIITGAGRGIGREHALLFAREGAKVVVNDLGGAADGSGGDATPAQQVAEEIKAAGGEAVANGDSVSSWEGAQRLVNAAVETFGDLDILVNNAGILRDRVVVNMTEEEWDSVVDVHLKGHFAPTRWAAAYWREQHKAGVVRPRNLVHTSSTSGLFSNPGQANYGAAKSGIATMSQICAKELVRYGVRSNCIAPAARTRLTLSTPGLGEMIQAPEEGGAFDIWDLAPIDAG